MTPGSEMYPMTGIAHTHAILPNSVQSIIQAEKHATLLLNKCAHALGVPSSLRVMEYYLYTRLFNIHPKLLALISYKEKPSYTPVRKDISTIHFFYSCRPPQVCLFIVAPSTGTATPRGPNRATTPLLSRSLASISPAATPRFWSSKAFLSVPASKNSRPREGSSNSASARAWRLRLASRALRVRFCDGGG